MDLTLGLGESPARHVAEFAGCGGDRFSVGMKLGFCMGLELELERKIQVNEENRVRGEDLQKVEERRWSVDPPLQLNLLPRLDSKQLTLSWPEENKVKSLNFPSVDEAEEGVAISSSPVRTDSTLPMNVAGGFGVAAKRASSRGGSDEDENDRGRKKLRLSKEQSAFLEESFKKQNTLNPKLKFALAKQLNLRPRQIEVWFQNRRARTKLKLMEMDCEFLKRRCETLREENRRLHKEVAELRAMKTFSFQMPPTKLSICPSCERLSPPTSPPQPPPTPR